MNFHPLHRLLFRSSTRAFYQESRKLPQFSFFDWLHAYIYGRWPYFYIGVALGTHPLAPIFKPLLSWYGNPLRQSLPIPQDKASSESAMKHTFADGYHGKVMPVETAARLISLNREMCLTDLESVVPYAKARDIILQHPDHIIALDCPCRASRKNPCLPLDVCLIVGEPFAGFILDHHPDRSRAITAKEAVEILNAEHKRGHVHHAFFKDVMLGRFYAICNCCPCCCGAMQARRNGVPMLCSSGFVVRLETEQCQACGACVHFCPFDALKMEEGILALDESACMGCGVCVDKCPNQALCLERDPSRSAPLDIEELLRVSSPSGESIKKDAG